MSADKPDKPELYIVAGPSGAGKSFVFNSTDNENLKHVDRFNIDDRLAQLNGSYQNIPNELRPQVNRELRDFIASHVEQGRSLSTETTLRHPSLLNWAERATERGFDTRVIYVAAESADIHVQRVSERAARGGHSAPPEVIRDIYSQSTANIPVCSSWQSRARLPLCRCTTTPGSDRNVCCMFSAASSSS